MNFKEFLQEYFSVKSGEIFAFIGQVYFGFGIDFVVLSGVSALFLVVGSYLFSKIEI